MPEKVLGHDKYLTYMHSMIIHLQVFSELCQGSVRMLPLFCIPDRNPFVLD